MRSNEFSRSTRTLLSTWIFKLRRKFAREVQPETEVSDVTLSDSECLADLTPYVVKDFTYATTAQGSFGDVWKCMWRGEDSSSEVAVKCLRIEIPDDNFKDVVKKRLMNDFSKLNQLKHERILPLYGITYSFGPVPAIVSPWMDNGSLSTYLDEHYDDLTETHKLALLDDVSAGLQYLHSNELAHANLTGNNVLIDSKGRARIADYGLLTTCSDLNGTSYIRGNVRWAAPELFEVPDTDDTCDSPKLESDVYSFGCIVYQVLSGHQPYYDIRSNRQVVVAIFRGVKPKRPEVPAIENCHWDVIKQCWLGISERPRIAEVRCLMNR